MKTTLVSRINLFCCYFDAFLRYSNQNIEFHKLILEGEQYTWLVELKLGYISGYNSGFIL